MRVPRGFREGSAKAPGGVPRLRGAVVGPNAERSAEGVAEGRSAIQICCKCMQYRYAVQNVELCRVPGVHLEL